MQIVQLVEHVGCQVELQEYQCQQDTTRVFVSPTNWRPPAADRLHLDEPSNSRIWLYRR